MTVVFMVFHKQPLTTCIIYYPSKPHSLILSYQVGLLPFSENTFLSPIQDILVSGEWIKGEAMPLVRNESSLYDDIELLKDKMKSVFTP